MDTNKNTTVGKSFDGANDIVQFIEITKVKPNPHQPRRIFDENSLNELATSIKAHGVLQPLLVEKVSDDEYRIIAGERRYRASNIAGLKTVPVIEKEFNNLERMEVAVTENIQRSDLNPIEEAMAYFYLLSNGGYTQEKLSSRLGKSRASISNSIRLLNLPQSMQDAILEDKITPGHARALLQVKAPADRETLFNLIINEGLTVRTAETLADQYNNGGRINSGKTEIILASDDDDFVENKVTKKSIPTDKLYDRDLIINIQDKFIKTLGTKTKIVGTYNKGKLIISYKNFDLLEKIYTKLGGKLPLVDDEE